MAYTAYTRCTVVPLEILEVESEGQSGTTTRNESEWTWYLIILIASGTGARPQGLHREPCLPNHTICILSLLELAVGEPRIFFRFRDFNDVTYGTKYHQVPIISTYSTHKPSKDKISNDMVHLLDTLLAFLWHEKGQYGQTQREAQNHIFSISWQ